MNDNDRIAQTRAVLAMHDSFCSAIRTAGGVPMTFSELNKMTAIQLFAALASNGIRFHYEAT